MANKKLLFHWIGEIKTQEDQAWASEYLHGRFIRRYDFSRNIHDFRDLINYFRHTHFSSEQKDYIDRLEKLFRNAWNQRKNRYNQRGMQTATFAISRDAAKQLREISLKEKMPQNKIVELLITGTFDALHKQSDKIEELVQENQQLKLNRAMQQFAKPRVSETEKKLTALIKEFHRELVKIAKSEATQNLDATSKKELERGLVKRHC